MTVKELFQLANLKNIASKWAEEDKYINYNKAVLEEEKENLRNQYAQQIYESFMKMLEIEEKKSDDVVVCIYHKDLDYEDSCFLDATLYKQHDLQTKEINLFSIGDPVVLSSDEYESKYIQGYSFEFSPWDEILGHLVAKASIDAYGVEAVAESIFNEMTFFGLDQDKQEENVEEEMNILLERVKEVEEHPERCIPAAEVFERLGFEPLSEEEKEKKDKLFEEEFKINRIERIKILEKVIEEYTCIN